MQRLKQWLVHIILKFLGLDVKLDQIDKLLDRRSQNTDRALRDIHDRISTHARDVDSDLNEFSKCFKIGVDVCPIGKDSWAIVCTVDKNDRAILRFIDLRGANMKYIEEFLYQSTPRRTHKHIDSPRYYPDFWRK